MICPRTTYSIIVVAFASRKLPLPRERPPIRVGGYQSGMGIAVGDIDNDGRPELAVTNYFGESTTLFHNDGHGLFSDRTSTYGLRGSDSSPTWFWHRVP